MASADPAWAETSVRWIRSKYPHLIPRTSIRTFQAQLANALVRMDYLRYEIVDKRGFSKTKYTESVSQMTETWNKSGHEALTKFLDSGGYPRLRADADARGETMKVFSRSGTEEFGIELDEVIDEIEKPPELKSQLSPKHELEEIVAMAVKQADPRYGAW